MEKDLDHKVLVAELLSYQKILQDRGFELLDSLTEQEALGMDNRLLRELVQRLKAVARTPS